MFRSRSWFGGVLWKPKNPHSLDHLKYLYNVLSKNQVVSDGNRVLLVETLRSIAEILIWGDQNDSSVFDFFLEKNMLSFFLKIMKQKCGSYVCVQLLQTLNILFENIRNETSLYYLLSNNYVNWIIVHKFDFSDEEVMAYYISFLKTLSLKLNTHTIHFFYSEHTNDFPLYTEAIKFFNHSESMVRIAVRTITLNVYRVDDKSMLKFIRDKTAAPYFSNLVWFIGNHVLELDICVRDGADSVSHTKLADLVAEHLDHLHYLNDILCLDISDLNEVLTDHLLNRLLIPLYVYSLTKRRRHSQLEDGRPHVSSVVSLFLLSQVFLILTHMPLVRTLAWIILRGNMDVFHEGKVQHTKPRFIAPAESLEKSLEVSVQSDTSPTNNPSMQNIRHSSKREETKPEQQGAMGVIGGTTDDHQVVSFGITEESITDEEKEQRLLTTDSIVTCPTVEPSQDQFTLANHPFLEATFNALECSENDYAALFALCLLYAVGHNMGVNQEILDSVLMPTDRSASKHWYNSNLIDRLLVIVTLSCQYSSKVRLVTLEMAILLVKQLVMKNGCSYLQDGSLAIIEGAHEESILLLRNFYKSEEIFLDMFEDEHTEMKKKPLNVEYLMMDSGILLPPTGTPLTGIEFSKRLPCGEVERARRAIRTFFLMRDLCLTLRMEVEKQLPLTNPQACIQVADVLDLNNSDLLSCTVITKDSTKIKRFLVIDVIQLILVEPDTKRVGWGVAKFVGFLQDMEVAGDKDDSRCLHITIHRSPGGPASASRIPLLSAKFVFDDHIRCMAAKQRLSKGRLKARQRKMHLIARLLELPGHIQPCPSPPSHTLRSLRQEAAQRRTMRGPGSSNTSQHRPMFTTGRVPGFAVIKSERDSGEGATSKHQLERKPRSHTHKSSISASNNSSGARSRESSPSLPRPHSEEIPLEDMSNNGQPRTESTVPLSPGSSTLAKLSNSPSGRRKSEESTVVYSSPIKQIVKRRSSSTHQRSSESDEAFTSSNEVAAPKQILPEEIASNLIDSNRLVPTNETSFTETDDTHKPETTNTKKSKRKGAVETV